MNYTKVYCQAQNKPQLQLQLQLQPTKESVQETVSNYSLDYGCPGGTSLPKKNQLVSSWLTTIIISRSNMDVCLHLDPAHPLHLPPSGAAECRYGCLHSDPAHHLDSSESLCVLWSLYHHQKQEYQDEVVGVYTWTQPVIFFIFNPHHHTKSESLNKQINT